MDSDPEPVDTLTAEPAGETPTLSAAPIAPFRPTLIATLVAIPAAALAGVGAFALLGGFSLDEETASAGSTSLGPVAVQAPPSSGAADAVCVEVLGQLPTSLGGRSARSVTEAPQRVVAWGEPPVVLRCGVATPTVPADAQLVTVNGVTWTYAESGEVVVWTTTGRPVPVELRVPREVEAQNLLAQVGTALTG